MLKLPLVAATAFVPMAFATGLVAQPKPAGVAPTANQIAVRVQNFYNKIRTYRAAFEQRYELVAYHKRKDSSGTVTFEKPGKMSWRYTRNGNRIVCDGKTVKAYESAAKQMYVSPMNKSQYPAALSFLVGGGQLTTQLTFRKLSGGFPNGYRLAGVPKTPTPAYEKLVLYVDAKTSQVRRVLLLDSQRNRNRFDFHKPSINLAISASEFTFFPPRGTRIVNP
jgi:outer membrane lipoprotein carrier protein